MIDKVTVRSLIGEVRVRRRDPAFEYDFKETDGRVCAEAEKSHAEIICQNPGFVIEEEQKGSFKKLKGKTVVEV
jgi:hypothetical protein